MLVFLIRAALLATAQAQGWRRGRATYYGAPAQISQAFDPSRGDGSFGIIAYGACGYTNVPGVSGPASFAAQCFTPPGADLVHRDPWSQGTLPFPKETYAAASDFPGSDLFPGSCGRCYEVRCKSGLLLRCPEEPVGSERTTNYWYVAAVEAAYVHRCNGLGHPVHHECYTRWGSWVHLQHQRPAQYLRVCPMARTIGMTAPSCPRKLNNQGQPIKLVYQQTTMANGTNGVQAFFDGDYARPYLPSINRSVRDTLGRSWTGNPREARQQAFTTCYDESKSVRIRIADSCPCKQVLKDGAPGVKAGGEVRRQEWCCGPIQHFDLSYWAFQQLAHPLSGAMMLQYRPVDCDTGAPVPDKLISPIIYNSNTSSGIQPGWSWFPYDWQSATLLVPRTAPRGGVSTCVELTPGGGLSFQSRRADRAGYQPFKSKTRVDFLIKFGLEPTAAQAPGIKLFVLEDEGKKYCFSEVHLGTTIKPVARRGEWQVYQVPLSAFKCQGALDPNRLDRLDFQNVNEDSQTVQFCLTDLRLV